MSYRVWEGLPSPDCQGLETFPTKRRAMSCGVKEFPVRDRELFLETGRLKPLLQPDESGGSHLPIKSEEFFHGSKQVFVVRKQVFAGSKQVFVESEQVFAGSKQNIIINQGGV